MKRFLWRSPIHLKIIAPILGFTAFGILVVYAIDTISEGWRVDHGATKNVTGADAICKKVTNAHAGNDYFVPTKTTTEWTAFQNNLPSGVTLNSCAATFVLTIAADTLDFNVRTAAIAAGWNGTETVAITVNVNPGITVGASTPTIPAFDT